MLEEALSKSQKRDTRLKFQIELDREEDGRWMAEIGSVPGVMAYGKTKPEAVAKVKALARRVLADQPVNKGGNNALH
jgi:predicted RNase H-like HicB family nuclease